MQPPASQPLIHSAPKLRVQPGEALGSLHWQETREGREDPRHYQPPSSSHLSYMSGGHPVISSQGDLGKLDFFFFFLSFLIFIYLFIHLWLCWVFVSVRGLSSVAASGGHSSSRCAGLSSSRPLLLRSTGSRCADSAIVAHGPSCSTACGILPDQGSNPYPLHWQADSQPLRHQGSPT